MFTSDRKLRASSAQSPAPKPARVPWSHAGRAASEADLEVETSPPVAPGLQVDFARTHRASGPAQGDHQLSGRSVRPGALTYARCAAQARICATRLRSRSAGAHACAFTARGAVWCWGDGRRGARWRNGRLGDARCDCRRFDGHRANARDSIYIEHLPGADSMRSSFRPSRSEAHMVWRWLRIILTSSRIYYPRVRQDARYRRWGAAVTSAIAEPEDPKEDFAERDLVRRAFGAIEREDAELLRRHAVDGASSRELAAWLGMSKIGAHVRLEIARERLRARLERAPLVERVKHHHRVVRTLPAVQEGLILRDTGRTKRAVFPVVEKLVCLYLKFGAEHAIGVDDVFRRAAFSASSLTTTA